LAPQIVTPNTFSIDRDPDRAAVGVTIRVDEAGDGLIDLRGSCQIGKPQNRISIGDVKAASAQCPPVSNDAVPPPLQ
jgi:hypothetical protein